MPSLDLPLEKLQQYKGSSPLPKAFDTFWENALKELDTLAPQDISNPSPYELEPTDFSAPGLLCDYLYFKGVGGARVCGKFIRPEKPAKSGGTEKIPGIVMFHGYTGNSGEWVEKLSYAYSGYAVLALDVRGQMGRSEDNLTVEGNTLRGHVIRGLYGYNPNNLFYRNIFLDTAQAARILMGMDFIDEHRIGATGASQGGALAITCAALEPRVKMCAPVYPFLTDYKRTWEMDLCKNAYEGIEDFIRRMDPRHENIDKMFETLGYIDISNLAPRIKAETYMFMTLQDKTCPPSTQFAVYNKMETKKSCEIYHNHGHEALPDSNDLIYKFFKGL
jgi:cephalosporin-C deacetylase